MIHLWCTLPSCYRQRMTYATRSTVSWVTPRSVCIGILNHLFFWPELYRRAVELSILFLFDENPVLLRPARAAQRSEAREVCRITPLARTQRERRRRLALATRF